MWAPRATDLTTIRRVPGLENPEDRACAVPAPGPVHPNLTPLSQIAALPTIALAIAAAMLVNFVVVPVLTRRAVAPTHRQEPSR
jgi:hypothetical protein